MVLSNHCEAHRSLLDLPIFSRRHWPHGWARRASRMDMLHVSPCCEQRHDQVFLEVTGTAEAAAWLSAASHLSTSSGTLAASESASSVSVYAAMLDPTYGPVRDGAAPLVLTVGAQPVHSLVRVVSGAAERWIRQLDRDLGVCGRYRMDVVG